MDAPGTQVIGTSRASLGRAYVLPFVLFAKPSEMEWSSAMGTTSLREKTGWGGGLRFGFDFGNAFIELQGIGYRNRFTELTAPGLGAFPASGYMSGLGFTANVGGRLSVSDKISLLAGGGLGILRQSVQLNIMGVAVPEVESWELSYQLFFGGGYVFNEHVELQLLYRWYTTHEMTSFSRRSMHMGEIALGYVF
jgi:opacity protein-like surface antigen